MDERCHAWSRHHRRRQAQGQGLPHRFSRRRHPHHPLCFLRSLGFSYYLGNPVLVEPGKPARVAFNMVRAGPPPPRVAGEGTGIAGEVRFGDAPLARAYVQVYGDAGGNFRGLGLASVPAGADGRFRIKLPPGSYYVVARKRRGGGMYGPPGKDD